MRLTTTDLYQRADRLPRLPFAHLPTPLEHLPRFSEALGGPRILIKRDDCTGLVFGGNKTRHNEFLLADAREQGAEMLVWGAGVQSNNCRQTAAACAKVGLDCHLILSRANHNDSVQGNLLLDHLVGATVEIVDAQVGPELDALIIEAADKFRRQGRRVYGWDRKHVKARAAVSYVLCMAELVDQLQQQSIEPAAVYLCSSGSTGAGLVLGKAALNRSFALRHMLPIHWPWDEQEDMCRIANSTAELLGLDIRVDRSEIEISGDYVGRAYGIPTSEGMEAIRLLARTEGVLLDPVYTAKAMAGLIDHVRAGKFTKDQTLVFIHTGGTPALFAYRDELVSEFVPT